MRLAPYFLDAIMNYRNFSQVTTRGLTALSLAAAVSGTAQAATPALPLITEVFVNKTGVLGMAWNPVANAASMRLQVASSGDGCPLTTLTRPAGCFVNQVVSLNGPLAPALKTGVSVANYNSGNVYARLVAVDSTGRNMTGTAWIKVPHYFGLTSNGKAWPLAFVASGSPVTVTATVTNSTAMTDLWAFDVQGNSSNKSKSGLNFTVTPLATGSQQAWIIKSKSGGLTIDSGTIAVNKINPTNVATPGPNTYAKFGYVKYNYYHAGSDYMAAAGSPVYAKVSGIVTTIPMPQGGTIDNHCMGNVVIMPDNLGKYYLYAHLQAISVKNGTYVSAGSQIGKVGNTGYNKNARTSCQSNAPAHLHLELKNSPILHNPAGSPQVWGYTPKHPDGFGYKNPE